MVGGNLTVIKVWLGQVYGVYRHFQQYCSYIVTISFIGGGNRSRQTLSHNVVSSPPHHERVSNSQLSSDRHLLHR